MISISTTVDPAPPFAACPRCAARVAPAAVTCAACLAPLVETGIGPPPGERIGRVLRSTGVALLAVLVAGVAFRAILHVEIARSPAKTPSTAAASISDARRVILASTSGTASLGMFEPEHGCMIGAFVVNDVNISGSMKRWVELTGKRHASYLKYVGYGRPFPSDWVASVRAMGASPNIALEPNDSLKPVHDDAYLHGFAREAAQSGGPVFLRFASEMNGPWTKYSGSPATYREKFRLVAQVMHQEAPNVAMVWTPYCSPLRTIPDYYPGDDAVDWVGVNIYSVHHHDGDRHLPAHREDPAQLLQPIYDLYADRKPIQISEYAATHFCKACGAYTADFAMDKMIRMYRSLPEHFPRVKMIYWFNWDTVSGNAACNNYAVTDDPVICDTYRRLVAPDYFLSQIPEPTVTAANPRLVRGGQPAPD